jgi:hypothetical protein
MDAFAANGECDVDAVIDKEGDVVRFAFCMEGFCCGDESACVGCFVAVLDDCDTFAVR